MVWIGNCDVTSIGISRHYVYTIWRSKLPCFRQNYITIKTYRWTTWNANRLLQGDPGQQRHSGSSYNLDWLNKTVRMKFPFAFILAGIIVALCRKLSNNKCVVLMMTSPLLSNIRHRAMITPVSPLLTRLIHISPSCWTIYHPFEIIREMVTVHWIGLQI